MNVNSVLEEAFGNRRTVHDANNLPEELNRGDLFAVKHSVMGEDMTGSVFKVEDKFFDPQLGTYKYLAFSKARMQPSHDPEEASDYVDFKFTIENGKVKPVKGYESVVSDFF